MSHTTIPALEIMTACHYYVVRRNKDIAKLQTEIIEDAKKYRVFKKWFKFAKRTHEEALAYAVTTPNWRYATILYANQHEHVLKLANAASFAEFKSGFLELDVEDASFVYLWLRKGH